MDDKRQIESNSKRVTARNKAIGDLDAHRRYLLCFIKANRYSKLPDIMKYMEQEHDVHRRWAQLNDHTYWNLRA